MKWHEPKSTVRPISARGIVILFCAIVILSFALGFMGGKYHVSNSLLALIFLAYPVAFAVSPFFPGPVIRLLEDGIVQTIFARPRSFKSRYQPKSRYQQIDTIHYRRNCSRPFDNMPYYKEVGRLKFTNFHVRMKDEVVVDDAIVFSRFSTVGGFSVPQNIDVEKILQILREKGVRLIESKSHDS